MITVEELYRDSILSITTFKEIKSDFTKIKDTIIKIRGFLQNKIEKKSCTFLTIRSGLETIQVYVDKSKTDLVKNELIESFVEVYGKLSAANVKACTISHCEIQLHELVNIGPATENLPFNLKDASNSIDNTDLISVNLTTKIESRSLDFRCPHSMSIFKVIDGIYFQFRNFLRKNGFMEIKTSKIIKSGSEGGANLFPIEFYDKKAFLAQSPQLYKQMAILGGFQKVYEIGHVYRAEEQNRNRYLSEFTGLDLEMEITDSYDDVIGFIYSLFVSIFDFINEEHKNELEIIRKYKKFEDIIYNKKPVVYTHKEAVDLLKKEGEELDYEDDFSRGQEKKLGEIVKKLKGVDFFVVKDYPASVRPFYTYVDKVSGKTRSYDFILRGEEILSGAQRVNNYHDLVEAIKSKDINPDSLESYLKPFKYGVPPHGGCGIGLERLIKSFFDFTDIRYFSMFPRTPDILTP